MKTISKVTESIKEQKTRSIFKDEILTSCKETVSTFHFMLIIAGGLKKCVVLFLK